MSKKDGGAARDAYEQLEYQRTHSNLFTTPTQCVNLDGSLTTYRQVTSKLRETRDKLVEQARIVAASKDFNPDYWFLMDELAGTERSVNYLDTEMKKALRGFTENYKRSKERFGDDL